MIAVDSFESVQEVLKISRRTIGSGLSAVEFIDEHAMNLVTRQFKDNARFPFDNQHPFYMLIEITSRIDDEGTELSNLLENIADFMSEGVVAQDEKQYQQLWFLRKEIVNSGIDLGFVSSHNFQLNNSV